MSANTGVLVEFYGIPRQRAGRAELIVPPGTAAAVLTSVERACPGLAGLLSPAGELARHVVVSLDGQKFLPDLSHPLVAGDRLLLLSADAGG